MSSTALTCLPAAAASRTLALLPDPIRFFGPGSRTLDAIRFAVPLLMGCWLVALLLQGVLAPAFYFMGVALAMSCSFGSEMWLRRRRILLHSNAVALWQYSERTLGPRHELTTRARYDADTLACCPLGRVTRTEERLRYTWELIRALRTP